jgi:small subunit ribosomal protein S1
MNSSSSSSSLGETVVGTVLSLEPTGALINIGTQTPAYLPIQEMSMVCVDTPEEVLKLNETREFWILASSEEQGQSRFVLSLRRLEEKLAWERLRQIQAEYITFSKRVVGSNNYGALVRIESLQGLIPCSEIIADKPIEELIGEEIFLQVIEVDEDGNRLVLSHKQALEYTLAMSKMKQFFLGEVVKGTVSEVKPFGAFIDIGGFNALLRITEISHEHIDSPHSIFQVNDEVKVLIIDIEFERKLISLSTKALEPEPGDMVKNSKNVYEKAEEIAVKYREKLQREVKNEYGSDVIKNVTQDGLEYIDKNGNTKFIDFKICSQNSAELLNNPKYVAQRNILGNPWGTPPYMEFFTKPLTKFIFNSEENFYELRGQIEQTGWLTFDLS